MNLFEMKKHRIRSLWLLLLLFTYSVTMQAQGSSVTGRISDEKGEMLIGVSVQEKGTTNGTITDTNGQYTLKLSTGNPILVISYIGYKPQEVKVGKQKVVDIVLVEDVSSLDEVVVVGYGNQRKVSVVGAQSSLDASAIKMPAAKLSSAISGRIAGVVAVQRSGEPGHDESDIWIRGISTLVKNGQSSSPLVLVDGVERSFNNIDPEDIKRKITDKTKAIIPVHLAGQPCDMDAIHAIAKEHHLVVIEDAAHALGSEYKGKMIGSMSDMTTFSFHPVKPITTGEGGMIVTNDETLYKKLVLFRSHGITRDESQMTRNEGSWFYQQIDLGYNYRMTDIQCALGCTQMKKLDRFIARRREIVERYNEAFADCKNIVIPYQLPDTKSGWHLYIIQVKNKDRKEVFESLRAEGIGVNVHYIPVYYHPYYQEHGYKEVHCPVAEELYTHIISLPIFPKLTDEQQDEVIDKVKKVAEN